MSAIEEVTENAIPKMNFVTKSIGIFTNPKSVFENLRLYPDWLLPVLTAIIVGASFSYFTQDLMLEFQKEAIYESTLVPEEYKDEAIEKMEDKSDMQRNLESVGGSLVNIFIVYLIGAGAFLVFGNFFLGGQASFKQIFSMFSWAGLIGVLELLVKLPMALAKGSLHVYTSLAVFLDPADYKTALFQLLNAFDVFTIWKLIIWAAGMSAIYQFSKKKGYIASLTLYGIYLAVVIGISQIF